MSAEVTDPIVTPDWLAERLGEPNVRVVDASWYLPAMGRNAEAEFRDAHIPGAVRFDIEAIADVGSGLPHTLAPPDAFAAAMGSLGVAETDTIVVYDGMGLFSAPRVWWNFRVMGALRTVILDGGLPAWVKARLPVESGAAPVYPALFAAEPQPGQTVPLAEMRDIVGSSSAQVLDARPHGRFTGEQAEPRAGMRSGHMPSAVSLPFSELQEDGRLKSRDALRRVFDDAGVALARPTVTTCGSGVTAAVISLALETVGARDTRLYDGSWSEWGALPDTPIVTGG